MKTRIMNKLTPLFLAGAAVIAAGLAVAQNQTAGGPPAPGHDMAAMTAPATDPASPSTRAFLRANARMHADMTIKFTGDADVDFMRGMIPHHQGAVEMARTVLEHGQDPEVRRLAQDVIRAQMAEIGIMERWLAQRAK